jgi:hypothetical protein
VRILLGMPDLPPAGPAPRRRRAPGARSLIAGALAGAVAIFGVLALRVHAGDDPALGGQPQAATRSATTAGDTTSSSSSVDPYEAPVTGGDDDGSSATSSGDQSSPAAAALTTRAS